MKNSQKGFANIVLIVLAVLLAGVVGYFTLVKKSPEVTQQTNTPMPATTQTKTQTPTPPPTQITTSWKSYTSSNLHISFKYPPDWMVKEGNDYPGSTQGNDYIKIIKGNELIYASAKQDCLNNYTYCKPSFIDQEYPYGWPFFSTQSTNQETKDIIDAIIKSATRPK